MATRGTSLLALVVAATAAWSLFGAREAAAGHVACNAMLTADTTLDANLNCSGTALTVDADGITIDFAGHTVSGGLAVGDIGVDLSNRTGVTIENGNLVGFDKGIYGAVASGNRIRDMVVEQIRLGGAAIHLTGELSQNNRILDNTIGGVGAFVFGDGISLTFAAQNNTIASNTLVEVAGVGVRVEGPDNAINRNTLTAGFLSADGGITIGGAGNLVERNTVEEYMAAGITVEGDDNRLRRNEVSGNLAGIVVAGEGNRITRNTVESNQEIGIETLRGIALFSVLRGNTVSDNDGDGIFLAGFAANAANNSVTGNGGDGIRVSSNNNQIRNNTVSRNTGSGIVLRDDDVSANANVVRGNRASANGIDGILVSARAENTELIDNLARRNDDDGIEVRNSLTTLTGNTASVNADWGFELILGVTDGGGNNAVANGSGGCFPAIAIAC